MLEQNNIFKSESLILKLQPASILVVTISLVASLLPPCSKRLHIHLPPPTLYIWYILGPINFTSNYKMFTSLIWTIEKASSSILIPILALLLSIPLPAPSVILKYIVYKLQYLLNFLMVSCFVRIKILTSSQSLIRHSWSDSHLPLQSYFSTLHCTLATWPFLGFLMLFLFPEGFFFGFSPVQFKIVLQVSLKFYFPRESISICLFYALSHILSLLIFLSTLIFCFLLIA